MILDGSWDETIGSRVHECLPGCVQIEPAEEKHTNRFHDAGARVLVVEPDLSRETLFDPCARLLGEAACFEDWGVATLARRVAREIADPDDLSGLTIEGLTLELLAHAARSGARRANGLGIPAWFAGVRERLNEEFQRPPRMADLAKTAGVHPMHLARAFRRLTGMSIGGYVRRLRLDWSAEQLTIGNLPLAEIAHRGGYADQSHFTREFRRYTGFTPRRYRTARNGGSPAPPEPVVEAHWCLHRAGPGCSRSSSVPAPLPVRSTTAADESSRTTACRSIIGWWGAGPKRS